MTSSSHLSKSNYLQPIEPLHFCSNAHHNIDLLFLFIAFQTIHWYSKPTHSLVSTSILTLTLLDPSWGCFDVWPWASMIAINDNFNLLTNNLPLCHLWQSSYSFSCSLCHHVAFSALPVIILFLPLAWCSFSSPCHHALSAFLSPFDINVKGNALWCSHA